MTDKRVQELEQEIANVRKQFSEINDSLKSLASEKGEEFTRQARRAYRRTANQAQNLWDDVQSSGRDLYDRYADRVEDHLGNAKRAVRDNPLQSIAIVAGVSFIIGFLTRR